MNKSLLCLAVLSSLASIASAAPLNITDVKDLENNMILNKGDKVRLSLKEGSQFWGNASAKDQGIVDWVVDGARLKLTNFSLFHQSDKADDVKTFKKASFTVKGESTVTLTGNESAPDHGTVINVTDMHIHGGTINLSNTGNKEVALGAYNTFEMTGGKVTLNGNSKLWLSTPEVMGKAGTMSLRGGDIHMTGKGAIVQAGSKNNQNVLHLTGTNVTVGKKAVGETPAVAAHASIRANSAIMDAGSITVQDDSSLNIETHNAKNFAFNNGVIDAKSVNVDTNVAFNSFDSRTNGTINFNTLTVNGGSIVTDSVTVAANSTLTVAAHTDVFTKKTVAPATREEQPWSITNNGTVAISGLTARDNGATVESLIGIAVNNVSSGNINAAPDAFINTIKFDENGKLTVTLNDKVDINSQYTDAAYAAYAGTGSMNDQVVQHLVTLGTVGTDAKTLAAFDQKTTDLATSYAKSGLYNVAYDAQSLVNDTIGTRAVRGAKQGAGVWVDVFGSTNEAELNGTAGYEADIYGGVFGADYALSDSWTLGGAIVFGTAEANGTNNAYAQDIDSDFYGLSVYTSKNFSGLTFTADAGYTAVENDIGALSADADVWTLGVRGEFAAYESDVLAVRPHFGVRYMSIDTDNVGVTENEKLNVFEMPVGVAFEGKFNAAGMKFVPMADLEVVQQLGDKEIEVHALGTYADDVNVVEGTAYRATFGLGAEMGQATFGLNYRYTGSNKDRNDHMIQARFGYQF